MRNFLAIFVNILSAKVALSETDKQDVEWFIRQHRELVVGVIPSKFVNKENMAYVVGVLVAERLLTDEFISSHFKTPTDVLRLMVAFSEGDVSLAEATRFRPFRKRERRLILSILDQLSDPDLSK